MEFAQLVGHLQDGGIALAVLVATLALRRTLLGRLGRMAAGRPKSFPEVLREGLSTPTLLWCVTVATDVLLRVIQLSERAEKLGHDLVVSFLILSLTMVASSILMRGIHQYGEQHNLPFAVAGLSRTLTQTLVFGVGLLVLLRFLGISVTPVLTALGVGGLAVALALQDTLANLFAGVHILLDRPISLGDYVRLSADEEGTVSDIGWRTTRLVTGSNSTVVIPNKTITSANLLNYSIPTVEVGASIPVIVGFDADMAVVERIAVQAAMETEGVIKESAPALIADPGMVPTHLQFRLWFRAPRQIDSGPIKTKVLKRMLEGFRKEGVPMPEVRPR